MYSQPTRRCPVYLVAAVILSIALASTSRSETKSPVVDDMVLVRGGVFQMGDLFDEGAKDERPVHKVRISDFYLNRYETTVGQFKDFVAETGYVTRAERLDSRDEQQARYSKLLKKAMAGEQDEEFQLLYADFLNSGGCHYWASEQRNFAFGVDCNWKTPRLEQTDDDPVMCIAWVDAASYCNWLSRKNGLPPAYDVDTGEFLDRHGNPTSDITSVTGYRLPTEAEWEFAAREGGKKVRFGNGSNVARAKEMNFDASSSAYPYSEAGVYRGKTVPVGSFAPNGLGLYDMSGNAWEWCSDSFGAYDDAEQVNPVRATGTHRVIRGGRWGGDAREARVFTRFSYAAIDRCNNAGFRIARTP